ncbi:MAG: thiamine phosphate synthase [Hyphomicrobiaceae bacterium]
MTPVRLPQPARFYPIVPDVGWLERIAPLGVATIQLRLKDAGADEVRAQIARSLEVCRAHGVQLVVNDYWREALAAGADYIHLGQEDLAEADLVAIKMAGVKFGLSTHDECELEVALAAGPDYIALGPIYETKLKAMTWKPQGIARIGQWKQRIGSIPLVAIAGLTPERAPGVLAAGAQSLAVITDFLTHSYPEQRIKEWLTWAETAV